MKAKKSILIVLVLAIVYPLSAQTLSGVVMDKYQNPVQQVNILNKNNDRHTHSDQEGKFVFENVSIGDTLQVSHVNFQDKILVVSGLGSISIELEDKVLNLDEVTISAEENPLQLITKIDIQTNPVNSSQEVLRKVPGLFIGQHAGGGKAEQLFLRGFDIDHGTDVAISVDGIPVNMVSHAHGQGYADLHFVIPETINKVDFGKGPYYQNVGNFNTAGYVDFQTKQKLDDNSIKLEAGQFDTYRVLGMYNLVNTNKQNAYVATEFLKTNGAFESPQNFNRINLFGKYTAKTSNSAKIGITASHFTSKWDASGQVPVRAIKDGSITRFGSIDDTEGGKTSRTNILVNHEKKIDDKSSVRSSAYWSKYDFELFSNFTFFLEDSINGDQIKQKESRAIMGANSEYKSVFSSGDLNGNWKIGVSLRNDQNNEVELSHTKNRSETLKQNMLGNINETNLAAYFGTTINIKKWTFNPAVRVDYFDFQYNDALKANYKTNRKDKAIVSPKLNIAFNATEDFQLYLKGGKGFHSNDTRVVVTEKKKPTLPSAYGFDAGFMWKPTPKMLLNVAYWNLFLEQEFVYVGDAGVVEPSGKTQRQGVDLSYRYQILPWLYWNLDANYTLGRAIEEKKGEDYIPLAPDFTLVGGLNAIHKSGIYGSINVRYMKDRPANEDNSIVAEGYAVTDVNLGYKWKKISFGVQIQNVFDVEWNETQFATESQLKNEVQSVEEIHFTPGTPFFLKTMIQYNF